MNTTPDEDFSRRIEQYRERLIEGLYAGNKQYDAAVLSLSSGALILSISFVQDIVSMLTPALRCLLTLSWVTFLATILLIVASFLCSIHAFKARIANVEKSLEQQEDCYLYETPRAEKLTIALAHVAGGAFAFGMLLTAAFAVAAIYSQSG
jgi:hypothetical protein